MALKANVSAHFAQTGKSTKGNRTMFVKTGVLLTMYLLPLALMLTGVVSSIPAILLAWAVMGIGKGFMGTAVMHDALHGSYSEHRHLNRIIGWSAYLLGAYPALWKIQHNVLHHTYTNIEGADEDIEPRYVLRFSPHQPHRWFHRFQHLYATFFYSLTTMIWVTYKDFKKFLAYRNKQIIPRQVGVVGYISKIAISKLSYFTLFLVLPMVFIESPLWVVISGFVLMHLITGTLLSIIFQTAHVIPSSEFVNANNYKIEENWHVHQLLTTSNFATGDRLISWLFGGLNFQIEHHLFPNICHIHYPVISAIVKETCREFGLPYNNKPTFSQAVIDHYDMLKLLGSNRNIVHAP